MVKLASTLLLIILSGLILSAPLFFRRADQKHHILTLWGSFIALRLIPFVLIYLVLDYIPRNDTDFFYHKALAVLQGKLVYRDFLSYHGPLFSYLISLPLHIWNNAKVLILFMALIEFVIVVATYRYYRPTYKNALLMSVLYYALPLPLMSIVLCSEEDVWFWGLGLLTLAVTHRQNSSFWIGILWGLGMIVIKSMLIVLLVPLFFLVRDKVRYVAGLALIGIPSLVILYLIMGDKFLMPIQHSGNHMPPNFVSVTQPVLSGLYDHFTLPQLNTISLLITLSVASYVAIRYRHLGYQRVFPTFFIFTFGFFMMAQPSAPGFYLFIYMIVILFELVELDDRKFIYQLLLLNVLTVVQPISGILYTGNIMYNSWSLVLSTPGRMFDYGIQVVEVYLFIVVIRRSLSRLENMKQSTIDSSVLVSSQ